MTDNKKKTRFRFALREAINLNFNNVCYDSPVEKGKAKNLFWNMIYFRWCGDPTCLLIVIIQFFIE